MSNFIPQEIVDEIKQRADLVDTINQFTELKKSGANLKGKCPACDSSSFTVTPSKQMFKCFGCGMGGKESVSFLMKDKKGNAAMTYPEALKWLADRNGININ